MIVFVALPVRRERRGEPHRRRGQHGDIERPARRRRRPDAPRRARRRQAEGRGGGDVLLGYVDPADAIATADSELPADGADVLRGGDGDDVLNAGSERGDAIYGDAGNDELRSAGNGSAVPRPASCGRGSDRVSFNPRGRLLADCEQMSLGIFEGPGNVVEITAAMARGVTSPMLPAGERWRAEL